MSPDASRTSRLLLVRLAGFVAGLAGWLAIIAGQFGHSNLGIQWAVDNYRVKEALAAGMPRDKILVVGGSSVLYGIRADDLGHALGWPALNFGNHAGLGLHYVLDRADRWVRAGDVVLLGLEYELYNQGQLNTLLLDLVMADDPGYLLRLSPLRMVQAISDITMQRVLEGYGIGGHTLPWSRIHYHLLPHLDGQGDELRNNLILLKGYERAAADASAVVDMTMLPENAAIVAATIERWKRRGATVIAISPPLMDRPQYGDERHRADMERIVAFYREQGVPMVLSPDEAIYPRRDFYDTRYHLDSAGAHMHTARIIERLRGQLPPRPDLAPWEAPVPTHRIAEFFSRYDGWEPRANLVIDESDLGREPFVRSDAGGIVIGARTAEAGPARLRAEVMARRPVTLRIRAPHAAPIDCPILPGEPRSIDVPLGRLGDSENVVIAHAEAVELPRMRIAWPQPPESADGPARGCAGATLPSRAG